jgi:hypothetical protein
MVHRLQEEKRAYEEAVAGGGMCLLCGDVLDPWIIQEHHIAGRKNNSLTIPVCPTCHTQLTSKQSCWPEEWTRKNNPPQIKKAFMLMGMADVMTLMGKQLRELALELVKGGEK